MKQLLRFICAIILFLCAFVPELTAQSAFGSEEELKAEASRLFDEEEFEQAYPLYSQLLSIYPKDPNYNYRLGVCMLYASEDKEKALPFLEFAAKRPDAEKEAIFYLARAYHINYRFDEAIGQFQAYKAVASAAKAEKLMVDRQIEMCKNGKKLLRNLTDLVVMDKKEMSRADFFRSYDISDIGGKLLVKPDEEAFKSSIDRKKKEKSIIYLSSTNNQVFFSSYGTDPERGKDIYIIRKLPNGEWSKPQTLGYPVNTEYDEDYPFLHPNGKVLYFCSKGHNSMGGYDIFKTTLNEETNTWNKPVNMDFPINTPDDDILYVTNEDEKEAYFSSARSSPSGKTAVFHINVERKPIDIAIIKGSVLKNRENQAVDVKITVKDLGDNTILGIYNSKPDLGTYLINLPNGGKFMYTVEAAGFPTQSEVVVLPTQYEFKPLKQEISYETGTDKLIIRNLFDEPVDDASYLLAMSYIKERSKMDIGSNPEPVGNGAAPETASENAATENSANSSVASGAGKNNESPGAGLSNADIIKIAFTDAKEASQEAKDLQEQADLALNLANQKNELAQNKTQEAAQLQRDADAMTDPAKKQETMTEANNVATEADILNQETVAAFNLARKLQAKAVAKDEEADLALKYAKDLEAAVNSKNPEEALAKLDEQERRLEELNRKNGNAEPDNIYSGLKLDEANKKRELDKATQLAEDLKQEIVDNETLMASLQKDADQTKKNDLKQGILDQITGLKEENEEKKKELESAELAVAKSRKEYNGVLNEMALVNNVVEQSKTATPEQATASASKVDQARLEQQVNEIKTSSGNSLAVNNSGTSGVKDPVSQPTNSGQKTSASDPVTTNSAQSNASSSDNSASEIAKNNTASESGTSTANNTTTSENGSNTGSAANTSPANKNVSDPVNSNSTETAPENGSNTDPAASASETKTEAIRSKYYAQLSTVPGTAGSFESESAKAAVYQKWAEELGTVIAQKETELKQERKKDKKKAIETELAELRSEQSDLSTKSGEILASAERIKAQQSGSASSTASNTVTESGTEAGTEAATEKGPRDFRAEIAAAAAPGNTPESRQAQASVIRDWNTFIEKDLQKQRADLAASSDPEMKALLQKKISDNEALLASNRKRAEELKANESISEPVVASETGVAGQSGTTVAASASKPVAALNSQLEEVANSKGSELVIEQRREQAYNTYIGAQTKLIAEQKAAMRLESDPSKKADLAREIIAMENELTEKQGIRDAISDKVAALEKASIAAAGANSASESGTAAAGTNPETTNNAQDPTAVNKVSDPVSDPIAGTSTSTQAGTEGSNTEQDAGTTEGAAGNKSGTEASSAQANSAQYSSESARKRLAQASAANSEAARLREEAGQILSSAGSSASEREAAVEKSDAIKEQADNKELEALQLTSNANRDEIKMNSAPLQKLSKEISGEKEEAVMAGLLIDESAIYLAKAEKSRTLANGAGSFYEKQTALEDAIKNEEIALTKQRSALDLFSKADPAATALALRTAASDNSLASSSSQNTSAGTQTSVSATNPANSSDNSKPGNKTSTTDPVVAENSNAQTDPVKSQQSATESNASEAISGNDSNPVVAATETGGQTGTSGSNTPQGNNTTGSANNPANTGNPANAGNAGNTNNTSSEGVIANNNSGASSTAGSQNTNSQEGSSAAISDPATASESSNEIKSSAGNLVNATESGSTAGANSTSAVSEIFERPSTPVYSAARPIPVNEKLPEGIIFKVQIGAFRNPIAPEIFTGMSPITAETTPQGLTRYTAGIFKKFESADKVKEEIRALGYRDAFVVAFLNGKRISVNQATGGDASQVVAASAGQSAPAASNTAGTGNNQSAQSGNNSVASSGGQQVAPVATINDLSGLIYTVQIGVYSKPVTADKLMNCDPLYAENLSGGRIRYTTGAYSSLSSASQARRIAFEAGIRDAFVIAYQNGKRITLPEAEAALANGSAVPAPQTAGNQMPRFGSTGGQVRSNPATAVQNPPAVAAVQTQPVVTNNPAISAPGSNTQPEISTTTPVVQPAAVVIDNGLVYKVQIGAFRDEVPLSIANQFLKIAKKGIRNTKDENGLTIYTVGGYATYVQANEARTQVISESGITDAFVVAYLDGKKISMEEARNLESK